MIGYKSVKIGITIIFFIIFSSSLYSNDGVKVKFASARIFSDNIVFSIKIENIQDYDIYILLDYVLQDIEYQENIMTIFAKLSSEPYPLQYDDYYLHDFPMPNFNIVSPGQIHLFHIIIKRDNHNIKKNGQVIYTVIEGLRYFISKPPNYDYWGTTISSFNYEIYSNFYKNYSFSFDTSNLLEGVKLLSPLFWGMF